MWASVMQPLGALGNLAFRTHAIYRCIDPVSAFCTDRNLAGCEERRGDVCESCVCHRMCGTSNMQLMEAAADAQVPRFVFVSIHDYGFPGSCTGYVGQLANVLQNHISQIVTVPAYVGEIQRAFACLINMSHLEEHAPA